MINSDFLNSFLYPSNRSLEGNSTAGFRLHFTYKLFFKALQARSVLKGKKPWEDTCFNWNNYCEKISNLYPSIFRVGSDVSIFPTGKLFLSVEPLMGYLGKEACSHCGVCFFLNPLGSSLIKPKNLLDKRLSLSVNIHPKGNRKSGE